MKTNDTKHWLLDTVKNRKWISGDRASPECRSLFAYYSTLDSMTESESFVYSPNFNWETDNN